MNNSAKDVTELDLPIAFMPAIFVKGMLRDVLGSNISKTYTPNGRPIVNTETCGRQVYLVQDLGWLDLGTWRFGKSIIYLSTCLSTIFFVLDMYPKQYYYSTALMLKSQDFLCRRFALYMKPNPSSPKKATAVDALATPWVRQVKCRLLLKL